jgi:hypothetical protein
LIGMSLVRERVQKQEVCYGTRRARIHAGGSRCRSNSAAGGVAVDLIEAQLSRINEFDSVLSSNITVDGERARQAARAAEIEITGGSYRGPLHGVTVAHKLDGCRVHELSGIAAIVPRSDAGTIRGVWEGRPA